VTYEDSLSQHGVILSGEIRLDKKKPAD